MAGEMKDHTDILWKLVEELFATEEVSQIRLFAGATPLDLEHLTEFDDTLGGPSVSHMHCGREARYEISDREVFRPLQYCGMYFKVMISKKKYRRSALADA
jgi:hypothetical protein